MAEFSYKNSVNRSTGISPFEAITGVQQCLPIKLVPLPLEACLGAEANNFIKHMQQIHDKVRRHIAASNDNYKAQGDIVTVRIHPARLLLGANKKLHPRNTCPF